ncbi:MAG TPA: hypothetical protein VF730_04335 [Terracidiphilus sp.]
MSLLRQNDEQIDDASLGEELTKGTSPIVVASIVAVVLVCIAIALYVFYGQKPPLATGNVVAVWAVPHHVETAGFDASGARVPTETFDQMLIFAQVRLHNQSQVPLFMNQMTGNVTLADGVHTSFAAPRSGYNDIFVAYPDLNVPHGAPLASDATIQPGQTVEGTIVCSFRMTKQEWDSRKDLNFGFGFRYQPSLKLTPQASVITDR